MNCVSCGAEITGKYCSSCGEQVLDPELRSLSHMAKDLIEDLTSVDGKLKMTLQYLLLKPGQLDYNYHIGKRNVFLKPITLFLLINVFYVTFATISDFYVTFFDQITLQSYSDFVKNKLGILFPEYLKNADIFAKNYDQLVKVVARSIIILQVPIYALIVCWLFIGRGRFASDHLVFAFNMHSFYLIWIVVATIPAKALFLITGLIGWETTQASWYFPLLFVGKGLYLFFAGMRAYELNWWQALWRLPLLFLAYVAAHTLFRLVQFLITGSLVEV